MVKKQKNIRLPEITLMKIAALKVKTGMNDAQIIIAAVECYDRQVDDERQQAAERRREGE